MCDPTLKPCPPSFLFVNDANGFINLVCKFVRPKLPPASGCTTKGCNKRPLFDEVDVEKGWFYIASVCLNVEGIVALTGSPTE